ncbi:hypothetical protein [Stenotrophomonas sp. SMYL11]|nr:hypothetical protein [Stenotrophomonas sp. SMYL11]
MKMRITGMAMMAALDAMMTLAQKVELATWRSSRRVRPPAR